MSKKTSRTVEINEAEKLQLEGAIALALISAPNPFLWHTRTISIDNIVEEVRNFLSWSKKQVKRIINAIKEALVSWLPAGWVIHNEEKKCIIVPKSAELFFERLAQNVA